MDHADLFLLRVLAGSPPLSAAEAKAVEDWWLGERSREESLAAFLVRRRIFSKESLKTVDLMEKGYISFCDAEHLFASAGVDRCRETIISGRNTATAVPTASPSSSFRPLSELLADQDGAFAQTERRPVVRCQSHAAAECEQGTGPQTGRVPLRPGMHLGKCLLTAEIGRGGSGIVFRGYHQGLNIPVAIKVLQLEGTEADRAIYEQLRFEARLLAHLNHPHVIRVLDFEDDAILPYLVLEYVEGPSLCDLIYQSGRLRSDRAVRIIREVCDGLEAAQKLGVVHRDVKPANILLTRSGSAKLADLGLALIVHRHSPLSEPNPASLQDAMAGTVAYMPPEQALGTGSVDHRSDMYALGTTFYHALTGQVPFRGQTRAEVVQKHMRESPVPPHQVVPELDPAVSTIVLRLMAKEPEHRFQSYSDLRAELVKVEARTSASPNASSASTFGEFAILGTAPESRPRSRSLWQSLVARLRPRI